MNKLFLVEAKRKKDGITEVSYIDGKNHDRVLNEWSITREISDYERIDVFDMNETWFEFIRKNNKFGWD
jgi:hypothetical protein